jgi:hypothetical protein
MRIDFTVTDDEGNELAFGGTSSHPTLKALADELLAARYAAAGAVAHV